MANKIFSGISALAAIVSVIAALYSVDINLKKEYRDELNTWQKGITIAGTSCMSLLAEFSNQAFRSFADRASHKLPSGSEKLIERCFVPYQGIKPKVGEDISEEHRSHLAHQIAPHLNAYDSVATYWKDANSTHKQEICRQIAIYNTPAIAEFSSVAKGTRWWNYPDLDLLIEGCLKGS